MRADADFFTNCAASLAAMYAVWETAGAGGYSGWAHMRAGWIWVCESSAYNVRLWETAFFQFRKNRVIAWNSKICYITDRQIVRR